MSKTTEVFKLRLVLVVLGLTAINQISCTAKDSCATPSKIVVSRVVKNTAGKSYIEVDGKPFLYNSVQSWYPPEKDYSKYVRKAAEANYKCFTFWLYWKHLEPKEGQYNWSELDKVIDLANEYDMRLDIVWAGTNFCDHLDPRFAPDWVLNNHDQYHLKDPNGNCILVDGGDMGNCCVINPANSTILQKEKRVISDMLQHLKRYDKNHRVIAIQVENEINLHEYMGGKSSVLAYVNALGRVVKESSYQIVTRANLYALQMDSDLNALEYIDGHGLDPYKESVSLIRDIINSDVNTKLKHIAENAAWRNSTSLIVAALANGGFYNIYRLDYDSVWNKPGVYDKNFEPWSVTTKVTNLNSALNKAGALIAAAAKAEMLEFNTETDYPSASYQVVKSLSGRAIGFQSRNDSEPVGLVVEREGQYYCMADNIAYFIFDVQPGVCETGYFDDAGRWVKTADRNWKKVSDIEYQIEYCVGECLRISAMAERAALQAQSPQVDAENVQFGYLVGDTNALSGALGNWCTQNSAAGELIVMDTTENSIGLDLGVSTTVTSVTVVGWDTMLAFDGMGNPNSRWKPRLNHQNTRLYYSDDNITYSLCSSYTTRGDSDTRMPHLPFRQFHFENLNIKARYIKVHCTLADEKWSWVNYQDRAITAGGRGIAGKWFPQRAAPKRRSYSWAADCLPFGSNCERGLNRTGDSKSWFGITAYHPTLFEQLNARLYEGCILWRKIGFISQKYIEVPEGAYDFEVFDKVIEVHKKYRLKTLGSFHEPTSRSNPKVDVQWFRNKTAANWKKYQDFVTTVVNRYKDHISFWEGWNEVEIPACDRVTQNQTGDYPKMAEFVTLQKTIYEGAKAADPNSVVLNGGFCGWGLYFVERILSLGVGQYMDVCGFHPYSNDPHCALEKVLAVRDMLDYYGYVDMPIWLTEIGWSSGPWPADIESPLRVADEQTKADYLKEALDLLLPHIQVFIWYASCERWQDEKQRMFGLFAPFPDAEPAYLKENLAFTVYANYTKKWYEDNNISLLPPVIGKK